VEGGSGVRLLVVVVGGLEGHPRSSGTHYRRRSMSLRLHWGCLRGLRPFRSLVVVAEVEKNDARALPRRSIAKAFAPDVDDHRDQHKKGGGEHLLEPSTRSISRRRCVTQFYSKASWHP